MYIANPEYRHVDYASWQSLKYGTLPKIRMDRKYWCYYIDDSDLAMGMQSSERRANWQLQWWLQHVPSHYMALCVKYRRAPYVRKRVQYEP